ncbi:PQQ-binding-like beta-propeller repeat protein [Paenibacillus donghaensis]|uniref:Pyrrolo-quinoline quinone repeat domain-containing protein n=1 Tax=Paenibacillus donghaensis TaxID=414771 RepID=A0A2Z2K8T0_9BACL|nr:PQQ-binding-like beta-propeller repeat protein [Paenibacillus donghaensis]ASA21774.1 hypothetical protein B9T62_13940 [Paenibacillus donghaensis]
MTRSRTLLTTLLAASLVIAGTTVYSLQDNQTAAAPQATITPTSSPSVQQSPAKPLKLKWQAKTDGTGLYDAVTPATGELVYYSEHGNLQAAEITSGHVKWTYPKGTHPEIVTANSVICITSDGNLVKLDAWSGKLIWKVKVAQAPIEIGAHAYLEKNTIYVINESGGISAHNAVTGTEIWHNKSLPMYVSDYIGLKNGKLLVSSTVDNIRNQFFGLDPATGKVSWRIEGRYSLVSAANGKLMLRQQPEFVTPATDNTPVPGPLLTLVTLNIATGTISKPTDYEPLQDINGLNHVYTSFQGGYIYSTDSHVEDSVYELKRIKLAPSSGVPSKSYETFGSWVAGPVQGKAFFQKGTQLTAVNIADDSTVSVTTPNHSQVIKLTVIGQGLFAGYEDGSFVITHAANGSFLGALNTGASEYGEIWVEQETVLLQTDQGLFAFELPADLRS